MPVLHIAKATFQESIRQPLGLMSAILIALLMFFAPAFTSFSLGSGIHLLRTNLLSTFLLGGIVFSSLCTTGVIQREIRKKTLLTILSRPVSLPQFYLGKWLGMAGLVTLFSWIMLSSCWVSLVIGTPDTAATRHNFIPLILVGLVLGGFLVVATAGNYLMGTHVISTIFKGWGGSVPIIFIVTVFLSPMMGLKTLPMADLLEFIKASFLVYALVLVIMSFSLAIGTITSPLSNLTASFLFLMFGLMGPGLEASLTQSGPLLRNASALLPDFHLFWMAENLSLERGLPLGQLFETGLYSLSLISCFSALGIYNMMRKDYS